MLQYSCSMAKKIKRFTASSMLIVTGTVIVFMLLLVFVPLVTFNNTSYEKIAADAANAYGLRSAEYQIEFLSEVKDGQGKSVQGNYFGYDHASGIHRIQVKKQSMRVFTIATIFHEFAHAAQEKYDLKLGKYNREQHAEILCFSTIMSTPYWWEGIHLLSLHTFFAKPTSYRVPQELWQTALTGTSPVMFVTANSYTLGD